MKMKVFDLATAQFMYVDMPTFKPDKGQEKYIRDGLAFLVVKAPFFAHLLYNECKLLYTKMVPYAATDGKAIYVNPDGLVQAKMGLYEIAFVLAHETAHVMFADPILRQRWARDGFVIVSKGRKLPFLPELMNIAEDMRINAMLVKAKIGKMPEVGILDVAYSVEGMESAVEIYEKLYLQKEWILSRWNGMGFDMLLAPSQQTVKQEETGQRQQAIASAAEAARSIGQGDLPNAIKRMLGDILEPRISWQDKMRSQAIRHAGDPTYDWRYLDSRLMARDEPMYFARQAHTGAGIIVLAGDTSGSINDKQIDVFFGEMGGIVADLNPMQVIVMWCDAAVHRVDELEEPEDLNEYHALVKNEGGVGGGGGTRFYPVFDKVKELGIEPDMLVYFTDMAGTFPSQEPPYPTIWASTTEHPRKMPFGELIYVEIE